MRFGRHIFLTGLILSGCFQLAHGQTQSEIDLATQQALEFLKAEPVNTTTRETILPGDEGLSKNTSAKNFTSETLKSETLKAGTSFGITPPTSLTAKPSSALNESLSDTDYADITLPAKRPQARLQKGQNSENLKTLDGLDIKRFARRLGDISSIARGEQGQLYIADTSSGRIFVAPDSDQNGSPEQIRKLPFRFTKPSAVLEHAGHLYIADSQAVWKVPTTRIMQQTPIVLASLQNTQSQGPFFLAAQNTDTDAPVTHITLGYSTVDSKARLVSVNTQTGSAQLLDETSGQLHQLSAASGIKPWTVYRQSGDLYIGTGFDEPAFLGSAVTVKGLTVPYSANTPADWPASIRDHVYISRVNPTTVAALPTSLGTVMPRGRNIFTGFQSGRTAWGSPGALHMDRRGLFVADPFNGDLWLIRPMPKTQTDTSDDRVNAAIDKFKAATQKAETPLKRNPLDGIYETRFPIKDAPSESPLVPELNVKSHLQEQLNTDSQDSQPAKDP